MQHIIESTAARPDKGTCSTDIIDRALAIAGLSPNTHVSAVRGDQTTQDQFEDDIKNAIGQLIRWDLVGTSAIVLIEHQRWDPTEIVDKYVTEAVRRYVFVYKYA